MSAPFPTHQRSDDSILISPQISHPHEGPRLPVSKKPRNPDESLSSSTHFSRRVNALFFKTRLCQRFRSTGSCLNGPHCSFAHGPGELRNPPPNWQEIVAKERGFVGESKICKRFYRGEVCPYGERCSFAHVEPGIVGNGSGVGMEGGDGSGPNGNGESIVVVGNGQRQGFWKTRMCNKWEANGYCPFGEKCHFAHGNAELIEWRSHTMELDKVNIEATTPFKPPLKPIRNVKHQIQENKGFLKCDGLQKISRIYADWIDDVPLRSSFCLPPKAGT